MIRAKIYAHRYIVTEDGQVFAMNYRNRNLMRRLKPCLNPNARCGGYYSVAINGRPTYIHRMVAECFAPRPPGCTEVNHKDGNKLNNHASNLEWVTHLENVRHAYRTGLITGAQIARNAAHPHPTMRSVSNETARRIKEMVWDGLPNAVVAELVGVKPGVVDFIRRGATYKDVPWPRRGRRKPVLSELESRRMVREIRKSKLKQENLCR